MAHDRINLGLIKDAGIRQRLQAAQQNGRLSDAEVTRIINAALADTVGNLRLDEQEVRDLLTIADQSVTMSPSARSRIRQTVLLEYTQYRIRDGEVGRALRLALSDDILTREELEEVVKRALDQETDAQGRIVTLSPHEVADLLDLARVVPRDFRRYILGILSRHVRPAIPPVTNPTPKLFEIGSRDKGGEYKIPVQILKDSTPNVSTTDVLPPSDDETQQFLLQSFGKSPGPGQGATRSSVESARGRFTWDSSNKVDKVTTWPRIRRINIWIEYGPGAKSTTVSGYGRGTKDEDFRLRNITLGWHENCHREFLINYLRNKRLPEFNGNVGQSRAVFSKHASDYGDSVTKYFKMAEEESQRLVDEVGYKRSEHLFQKL